MHPAGAQVFLAPDVTQLSSHAPLMWLPITSAQPPPDGQHTMFVPAAAAGVAASTAAASLAAGGVPAWQPLPYADCQHVPMMVQQPPLPELQHPQQADGGKKRLRWSAALHARFVEAVMALGGALHATPKRIQAAMAVPGLTLFHVKSHLQKYRSAIADGTEGGMASGGGSGGGAPRCHQQHPQSRLGEARKKRSAARMAADAGPECGSSDSEEEDEAGSQGFGSGGGCGGGGSNKRANSSLPAAPPLPLLDLPLLGGGGGSDSPAAGGYTVGLANLLSPAWDCEVVLATGAGAEVAAEVASDVAAAPAGGLSDDDDSLILMLPQGSASLSQHQGLSSTPAAPAGRHGDADASAASGRASPSGSTHAVAAAAAAGPAGAAAAAFAAGAASMSPPLSALTSHQSPTAPVSAPTAPPAATAACAAAQVVPPGPAPPAAPAPPAPAVPEFSGCSRDSLLQAAFRVQVDMQKQLANTIEVQRELQLQLEAHSKYIAGLLRSDGIMPANAPAAQRRSKDKGRGGGGGGSGNGRRASKPASCGRIHASSGQQQGPPAGGPLGGAASRHVASVGRSGSAPQLASVQVAPAMAAGTAPVPLQMLLHPGESMQHMQMLLPQPLPVPQQQAQYQQYQQAPAAAPGLSRLNSWPAGQTLRGMQYTQHAPLPQQAPPTQMQPGEMQPASQAQVAELLFQQRRREALAQLEQQLGQQLEAEADAAVLSPSDVDLLPLEGHTLAAAGGASSSAAGSQHCAGGSGSVAAHSVVANSGSGGGGGSGSGGHHSSPYLAAAGGHVAKTEVPHAAMPAMHPQLPPPLLPPQQARSWVLDAGSPAVPPTAPTSNGSFPSCHTSATYQACQQGSSSFAPQRSQQEAPAAMPHEGTSQQQPPAPPLQGQRQQPQLQQAPLLPSSSGVLLGADAWDSLLAESGVLNQQLSEAGDM